MQGLGLIEKLLKDKEQFIRSVKQPEEETPQKTPQQSNLKKQRENSLQRKNLSPKRKKNNSANPQQTPDRYLNDHFFPIIKNYEILEKIGQGSYGQVFKGVHLPSKTEVAIKVYQKQNLTETRIKSIKFEINLLLKIDHPHIVKFIDCFSDSQKIFLIMELIRGQNLFEYFKSKFKPLLEDFESQSAFAMHIFRQLVQTLYFLHKNKVNH